MLKSMMPKPAQLWGEAPRWGASQWWERSQVRQAAHLWRVGPHGPAPPGAILEAPSLEATSGAKLLECYQHCHSQPESATMTMPDASAEDPGRWYTGSWHYFSKSKSNFKIKKQKAGEEDELCSWHLTASGQEAGSGLLLCRGPQGHLVWRLGRSLVGLACPAHSPRGPVTAWALLCRPREGQTAQSTSTSWGHLDPPCLSRGLSLTQMLKLNPER